MLTLNTGSYHRSPETQPQGHIAAIPEGSRPGVWPLMIALISSNDEVEGVVYRGRMIPLIHENEPRNEICEFGVVCKSCTSS
jgi:hypothetical protein